MLQGIIIQSGNDASVAMAEHIAGTEKDFANIMNHTAKQLGMNNSSFTNAAGLPDPNLYTTAKDLAILATALLRDHPKYYYLFSQKYFTYNGIKQPSRNRLLWDNPLVDGIKTGQAESAQFCIAASAKKGAILLGTQNDALRVLEANKLLKWGFRTFESATIYKKNNILKQENVWFGTNSKIDLGLYNDLAIIIPTGQRGNLSAKIQIPKTLKAPISKGQSVGKYTISLNNNILAEAPIIAMQDINKSNPIKRLLDSIQLAFYSLLKSYDNTSKS